MTKQANSELETADAIEQDETIEQDTTEEVVANEKPVKRVERFTHKDGVMYINSDTDE